MFKILLASNNLHKLNEISSFFDNKIKFILPSELGIFDLKEENGFNFFENARLKVKQFSENIDYPILGDDSGLVVIPLSDFISYFKKNEINSNDKSFFYDFINFNQELLKKFWEDFLYKIDLFPGVVSKRFGYIDDEKIRNQYLIEILKKINSKTNLFSENDRDENIKWQAYFETALALRYNGKIYDFFGKAEGFIIDKPSGENGFGYDPIFFYPPLNKTFGQLSLEEKNKVSHRSKALFNLKKMIENLI